MRFRVLYMLKFPLNQHVDYMSNVISIMLLELSKKCSETTQTRHYGHQQVVTSFPNNSYVCRGKLLRGLMIVQMGGLALSKQTVYVRRISVHHESKSTRTVWSVLSGPLAYLIEGVNREIYEKQSVQRL